MPADSRRTSESEIATASLDCSGKPSQRIAPQLPADDAHKSVMPERRKNNKKTLSVRLDPSILAKLKAVARDAAGKPLYASVSGIVEAGIIAECDRLAAILDAALAGAPLPTERQRITPKRNTTNANSGPVHQ